jgi:pimeloyl-ACP methyl ester carboxylesterase
VAPLAWSVNGQGRPIVVLPWFGSSGQFAACAVEPATIDVPGYQRVYLDLPGTGESPACAASSDAVLAEVAEWVGAELGREPFALVGFSYGGYLAAGLARRMPGQISRLLLVCSGVQIRPDQRDLSDVLRSDPEPGWLDGVDADLHEHLSYAVGVQTDAVAQRLVEAFNANGTTDNDFLTDLREHYELSDEASSSQLDSPVRIVAGRRDRIAGFKDQFNACLRWPNSDYVLLSSAGHYLPFEEPNHFRTLTLDWLRADAP